MLGGDPITRPQVLLLASRFDFTCDYVVAALRRRGVTYLRLNSEDIANCGVTLFPTEPRLNVVQGDRCFMLTPEHLHSVLYRRPVYIRDYGDDHRSAHERFCRLQWAAFMQNLAVFDAARWYNSPASTYRAEHKAIQLREAARLGMDVPPTAVTNAPASSDAKLPGDSFALKGLDTVMIRESGQEAFGFTTFATGSELVGPQWASAPTTVQCAVPNKTDIRVTVIGERVLGAAIVIGQSGVSDDWRLHKDRTSFIPHELPADVSCRCVQLVAALGLRFGAIDFALTEGRYHFLEVNPTGEWAWLVDSAGLPIDEVLADELVR